MIQQASLYCMIFYEFMIVNIKCYFGPSLAHDCQKTLGKVERLQRQLKKRFVAAHVQNCSGIRTRNTFPQLSVSS